MIANIVTGVIFAALIGYGLYRWIKSARNNSCPGCSGSCSIEQRRQCKP
jgi:anaerobic selenocysteine-containing dehydrogenase